MVSGEWAIGRPSLDVRSVAAHAAREVWRFLPAWMFLFYGCLLLNTQLTNLDPPRADLAHTVVFPLAVFLAFYVVRALRSPDVTNRAALLGTAAALSVGLPLLNISYHRPSPLSIEHLRLVYEWSNFLWAGLLFFHAYKRDKSHAALFFGAGLFYGTLLENGGIVLGYFSEHHLTSTMIPPFRAPLATMLGWCVVLYMATFVVWELRAHLPFLRRSAALSALAVAAAATLLDLQIDPLATAVGCWVWHESLPPFFHGVPLVNFVAWMCALSAFAYVMFRHQERAGIADGAPWAARQLWFAVASVPAALGLAAVTFMSSMMVLEGPNGPSWEILYAFTDGALGALMAAFGG